MSVEGGGSAHEFRMNWPIAPLDIKGLKTEWLGSARGGEISFSQNLPQFLALKNRQGRLRARLSDAIESTVRFTSLFLVEVHLYIVAPLAHKLTGSRILYVTLRAYAENYTVVNNETEFRLYKLQISIQIDHHHIEHAI